MADEVLLRSHVPLQPPPPSEPALDVSPAPSAPSSCSLRSLRSRRQLTWLGLDTIMWQSMKMSGTFFLTHARIGGPIVMLGTKWPSMTSAVSSRKVKAAGRCSARRWASCRSSSARCSCGAALRCCNARCTLCAHRVRYAPARLTHVQPVCAIVDHALALGREVRQVALLGQLDREGKLTARTLGAMMALGMVDSLAG